MVIAVIVAAAAVVIVAAIWNSEDAVNGPHRAADTRSDSPAHHSADRSGRAAALADAFLGSADDALRVAMMGNRKHGQGKCRSREVEPSWRAGRQRQCPDLRHIKFPVFYYDGLSTTPVRPKGCGAMMDSR